MLCPMIEENMPLILTKEGKRIAREIDLQFKKHIAKKVAQLEQEDLNSLKIL